MPNENLIELRSEGEGPIDGQELKSWLVQALGVSLSCFAVNTKLLRRAQYSFTHAVKPSTIGAILLNEGVLGLCLNEGVLNMGLLRKMICAR